MTLSFDVTYRTLRGIGLGSIGLVAFLATAGVATAASPVMGTSPFSTPVCGVPGRDTCCPGADVFTNFPAAPPVVAPVVPGLLPGDVLNSFSWGIESPLTGRILFSVSPASTGIAGAPPDVFSEAAMFEAAADIYDAGTLAALMPNKRIVDGDGLPFGAPPASGLIEPIDDMTALGTCDPFISRLGFFTLATGSPTLPAIGASPGDILGTSMGGAPGIFVAGVTLGLLPGDVIDALALRAAGLATSAVVSLAPGSPTLALWGLSPADLLLLMPGVAPVILLGAPALGLTPFDDVDALDISNDIDGDLVNDNCDNCPFTFNNAQLDGDADGIGDACDNCPLVANGSQVDTDGDTVGDVCDNCPAVANTSQTDTDGDLAGDACDVCTGGVAVTKPQLKFKKLGTANEEGLQVKGTAAFPGALPLPPLDVRNKGMRVQIVDLGASNAVILDHTIPGGAVPTACGAKDGWKANAALTTQSYKNLTDQLPPFCAAGSALGIGKALAKDKTAASLGLQHKVQGKNGNYGPVVGPFRVSVVYGGAAESVAGQCSEVTFTSAQCVANATGTSMQCK